MSALGPLSPLTTTTAAELSAQTLR